MLNGFLGKALASYFHHLGFIYNVVGSGRHGVWRKVHSIRLDSRRHGGCALALRVELLFPGMQKAVKMKSISRYYFRA